jgi:hypothetical protein
LYSAVEKYTFFSAAHGTFPKIDDILGHKIVLENIRKLKCLPVFYQTTME